jgi:hypothetical protein
MAKQGKSRDQGPSPDLEGQQRDLVRKLPDETHPAEERGERLATGKAIATGGKEGAVGGEKPRSERGGDASVHE